MKVVLNTGVRRLDEDKQSNSSKRNVTERQKGCGHSQQCCEQSLNVAWEKLHLHNTEEWIFDLTNMFGCVIKYEHQERN